jgi:hypothetical protein
MLVNPARRKTPRIMRKAPMLRGAQGTRTSYYRIEIRLVSLIVLSPECTRCGYRFLCRRSLFWGFEIKRKGVSLGAELYAYILKNGWLVRRVSVLLIPWRVGSF